MYEDPQGSAPVLTMDRCHFTSNMALSGGGAVSAIGEVTVSNSVFSTNQSMGAGGGIFAGCCNVRLVNNSFWNNYAQNGGDGTYVSHAILANNVDWANTWGAGVADRFGQTGSPTLLLHEFNNNIQ